MILKWNVKESDLSVVVKGVDNTPLNETIFHKTDISKLKSHQSSIGVNWRVTTSNSGSNIRNILLL